MAHVFKKDISLSLKKGSSSRGEVMLVRHEEIKPLRQPGQYDKYDSFPFTSLFNDNELS